MGLTRGFVEEDEKNLKERGYRQVQVFEPVEKIDIPGAEAGFGGAYEYRSNGADRFNMACSALKGQRICNMVCDAGAHTIKAYGKQITDLTGSFTVH